MAKPTEDANNDLTTDIAEAVGKTIGNIVNRIEALDTEKAQLMKRLEEARDALNAQFNKWLPAGFSAAPTTTKGGKGKPALGTACTICDYATDPYHDARAKEHRDQPKDRKVPLSDEQLAARKWKRIPAAE